MDSTEHAAAIEEIEKRVERLRALYEQYFMGFERIEPLVQRKDIDRRLHVLRREQIRNTGLRFRFNQVVARYNTLATIWQRTVRQIEAGTHKRDVARAAKRFGTEALTAAARRRFGRKSASPSEPSPPPSSQNGGPFSTETPGEEFLVPISSSLIAAVDVQSQPPGQPSEYPASISVPLSEPAIEVVSIRGRLPSQVPPSVAGRPPGPPPSLPRRHPEGPASGRMPPPVPSRELVPPSPVFSGPVRGPRVANGPPAQPMSLSRPMPRDVQLPAMDGPREPKPLNAPADAIRAAHGAMPPRPPPTRHDAGAPAPSAPGRHASPPEPRIPAPVGEARLRELYREYVDARRQCNEPTERLSVESLAKTLRASESKLRERHPAKAFDYEVVIRDGHAVLKPVVRGGSRP